MLLGLRRRTTQTAGACSVAMYCIRVCSGNTTGTSSFLVIASAKCYRCSTLLLVFLALRLSRGAAIGRLLRSIVLHNLLHWKLRSRLGLESVVMVMTALIGRLECVLLHRSHLLLEAFSDRVRRRCILKHSLAVVLDHLARVLARSYPLFEDRR